MKFVRATLYGLILAALVVAPTVAKPRPHALTFAYSVAVTPDPLVTSFDGGVARATTDRAGWLTWVTPCVHGWVNVAVGTSDVEFSALPGCEGTYSFWITDAAGAELAGPFTFVASGL